MNCILIYFTGTFNTRYLTQKLKARLEGELGWCVTSYEIDPLNTEKLPLEQYDIIGLGYPIHGYCAPYAFLKFIRAQHFSPSQRVFIYKNSGETETANDASSKYVVRKLRRDRVDEQKCNGCGLCVRNCPTQNIYRDKDGKLRFHHHCLMCMRCSFFCPTDAFHIGFLEDWGWKVNGAYNFKKIEAIPHDKPYITEDTTGFFKCYIKTFDAINKRHQELFGK